MHDQEQKIRSIFAITLQVCSMQTYLKRFQVKSSEQELRQTSLLVIPLLGILALLYTQRWRLAAAWPALAGLRAASTKAAAKAPRPDLLDKASIDHILNTVNPPKKTAKKKAAFL